MFQCSQAMYSNSNQFHAICLEYCFGLTHVVEICFKLKIVNAVKIFCYESSSQNDIYNRYGYYQKLLILWENRGGQMLFIQISQFRHHELKMYMKWAIFVRNIQFIRQIIVNQII